MGNFGSHSHWIHEDIVSGSLPVRYQNSSPPVAFACLGNAVAAFAETTMLACQQVARYVMRDVSTVDQDTENSRAKVDMEWTFDHDFEEVQVVVDPTFMDSASNHEKFEFLRFQDINAHASLSADKLEQDECGSWTTDDTEWLSESEEDSETRLDAATLEEPEHVDESDDIATKASRLLNLSSCCPPESDLFVVDYLCGCGECPAYATIVRDVQHSVTWREPGEKASIIRLLQAYSTYNEAIGFRSEMIVTADECLCLWRGDEDRAFTSFVLLQDDVPALCATAPA